MNQFLIIIRGGPASGKTTIAKKLRNFDKKTVWLKVDNFKDFFSDEARFEEQKYVDECALATLEYLLHNKFSVVMEKIFYDPIIIPKAIELASKLGVKYKVFQVKCSLQTLQERDKSRPGIKEGCREPLGNELIQDIYNHLENTYYPGATPLDTEQTSPDDCVGFIKNALEETT